MLLHKIGINKVVEALNKLFPIIHPEFMKCGKTGPTKAHMLLHKIGINKVVKALNKLFPIIHPEFIEGW
jgi:hypothetical protein